MPAIYIHMSWIFRFLLDLPACLGSALQPDPRGWRAFFPLGSEQSLFSGLWPLQVGPYFPVDLSHVGGEDHGACDPEYQLHSCKNLGYWGYTLQSDLGAWWWFASLGLVQYHYWGPVVLGTLEQLMQGTAHGSRLGCPGKAAP